MRRLHYSIYTEKAYCDWISRFIKFHHIQDRNALLVTPENKIEAFLTYLAVKANVAASTQNQAFNALIFYIAVFLIVRLRRLNRLKRARKNVFQLF